MTRFNYTGCLLAAAFAASGAAHGQQACRQDIQQLETQLEERQVDEQTRRQVQELLDAAQGASDQDCQQIVTEARDQLEGLGQSQQVAQSATQQRSVRDRKSTRLNSSHVKISYAVFCLKKKTTISKS